MISFSLHILVNECLYSIKNTKFRYHQRYKMTNGSKRNRTKALRGEGKLESNYRVFNQFG